MLSEVETTLHIILPLMRSQAEAVVSLAVTNWPVSIWDSAKENTFLGNCPAQAELGTQAVAIMNSSELERLISAGSMQPSSWQAGRNLSGELYPGGTSTTCIKTSQTPQSRKSCKWEAIRRDNGSQRLLLRGANTQQHMQIWCRVDTVYLHYCCLVDTADSDAVIVLAERADANSCEAQEE